METASRHHSELNPIRQTYLWVFISGYTLAFFLSNWLDPRLINVFGLNAGAGSFIFPLTYLISDIITEVYGYKHARVAVWVALLFFLIFILYDQLIVATLVPGSISKVALSTFLVTNNRILLASILSYLVTESINSYIVAKLKISLKGKYMGIRFIGSTLTAYTINELIYAPIAFYGFIPNFKHFLHHMLASWVFMVSIELLLLPFSIRLAKRLKNIEDLDIYDTQTNFNPFSLNTDYQKQNNKSKKN
ncbi:queuosine precursor transporter [Rickettsiella endosymbiont of Xylota segnis]|uniref:queuosine precursor transporter n=1 Tax=Rickettsiella endosymbiont of Xylota segnis TaxID=3066238 RepID=UPI0030D4E5A7